MATKPAQDLPLCCNLASAGPPSRIQSRDRSFDAYVTSEMSGAPTPQALTTGAPTPEAPLSQAYKVFEAERNATVGADSWELPVPPMAAKQQQAPNQQGFMNGQTQEFMNGQTNGWHEPGGHHAPYAPHVPGVPHQVGGSMAGHASAGRGRHGKGRGKGPGRHGMHGQGMPVHVHHGWSSEHSQNVTTSNVVDTKTFEPGSFRLPFTMLRVVLDELADRISVEKAFSATELSAIADFSVELQSLSCQANSANCKESDVKPELVLSDKASDSQEGQHSSRCSRISTKEMDALSEDLMKLFQELDSDGGGTLTADELRRGLVAAGMPQARLTKLLRSFDTENTGVMRNIITMDDWISAVKKDASGEMAAFVSSLQRKSEQGVLFVPEQPRFKCILHANGHARIAWDFCILILCCYIAAVLPFRVAWEDFISRQADDVFNIVDRIIDCMFALDIILNFFTSYYAKDGQLVEDRMQIALNYLKTWFLLDVLSTFPFDDAGVRGASDMQIIKLLKLGKLLKIIKVMMRADMSQISELLEDISTSKAMQIVYRRSAVLINMVYVCHWMACGMKIFDEGWLVVPYQDAQGRMWNEYLAALYWSMTTLTTVGYGDITPSSRQEQIYTTLAMVVGAGFYGYVVGSITTMVSNSDLNATAFYDRMELIHAWLTHHKLPTPLRMKLRRYFKLYLAEKSVVSEAEIWRDLSPELQREVGEFIVHENVRANPLFDGLNVAAAVRLQSILQKVTVQAGGCICSRGEAGTAMYIVDSGTLQMKRSAEGEEVLLGPGQSFGEEILLSFVDFYEYTVVVLEKARLEMITEDEFLGLFSSMPNVLERMRTNALSMNPDLERK